jgi:putative transposase
VTTDTWQRREIFRKAAPAEVVEQKIFEYRDKGFYYVHRYVIMPEHLHILLTPCETATLEKAIQLIKGGSSHEIGLRLRGKLPLWHGGFSEHQIRDEADHELHVAYIDMNPVKAGLAQKPNDYPFSSANGKYRLDPWPVASGAKAHREDTSCTAGLKPRPSEEAR